ncbi:MAG: hypothetical protein LUC41_07985 [Clostridiales bacterium]|nr:hypothetical protein [Clostridiales bacterium]
MKLSKIIICFTLIGCIVAAAPIEALAASSSEIEQEIAGYTSDLDASRERSEELETEISAKQEEVGALYSEVESLNLEKQTYYEGMKQRIIYFYEERQGNTLISTLMGAGSFSDFISAVEFQQSIYDYDTDQMDEYQALIDELAEKQAALDADLEDLGDMVEEQNVLQATLEATISDKEEELSEAKAREAAEAAAAAAAAEEAKKRAEQDAVQYAMASVSSSSSSSSSVSSSSSSSSSVSSSSGSSSSGSSSSGSSSSQGSSSSGSSSSSSQSSSGGVLTKEKGVVYYNGHRETYYSQNVLPGGGLNIPGRHVAEDGTIRDEDGYICVASSDYPLGTVVETSLGTGKVYDTGCASGTIDIYTNW